MTPRTFPWARRYLVALATAVAGCAVAAGAPPPESEPLGWIEPVAEAAAEPATASDAPAVNADDAPNVAPTQYLEESLTHEDPAQEAWLRAVVDRAVTAKLAGIPRPRYIPATDIAPPKGLLLFAAPRDHGDFPFAMSLSGFMQLRWFEFARDATSWQNAANAVLPVNNINTFNLNRFLVSLSGHVVDERLIYRFAFFGTSNVGIRSGVVPIGVAGWKFSEAATLGAGVTVVPGSREWIDSSSWTVGVDRSMANTFFRPGYSPGALATGSLLDGELHYQGGVWNAIDGGTTGVLRRGTAMAFAGNTWWEPAGPYGLGPGDMECHDEPVVRLGTSGVYAKTYPLSLAGNNPEDTIVRLSDGTPLAARDALGIGSQVQSFLYHLATVDAGVKYDGWAVNFEYYFRLLDGFQGIGTFDRSSSYDHGGQAYLSWCFLPRTCEAYARSSAITGPFGTGQEYGGGLNWYVNRSRQGRFTLEALTMSRNPAQNFLYPYRAGYTGTAIQTQLMVTY